MKCLSIQQPWAGLIVAGIKDIENRTWATRYRGPLLVHAGKTLSSEYARYKHLIPASLRRCGGILGQVELAECVQEHASRWFLGPFGFVLRSPRTIHFRPLRGKLGLFEVDLQTENLLADSARKSCERIFLSDL